MYTNNALLFPEDAIPILEDKRGRIWRSLVKRVIDLPHQHEERLAFMLFMMRLNGCIDCETDCYRAMRGCHACSLQSLRRYKGTDEELLSSYQEALADIRHYSKSNQQFQLFYEDAPIQQHLPISIQPNQKPAISDLALASL
ncbi:MAG: hypothetical protein OXF22_07975 [Anaerolineaceae bacterium]|nr:hypothetical protein [Anaerolineaceae bacterium]